MTWNISHLSNIMIQRLFLEWGIFLDKPLQSEQTFENALKRISRRTEIYIYIYIYKEIGLLKMFDMKLSTKRIRCSHVTFFFVVFSSNNFFFSKSFSKYFEKNIVNLERSLKIVSRTNPSLEIIPWK